MDKFLLIHLLQDSVLKYPEKKAIIEGHKSITYKELDEKSNLLANNLIQNGLKPKEVVVVYINKSIEAVICFLGVLKAGGIYIPADGNYSPGTRIASIINASESRFVISKEKLWEEFLNTNARDIKGSLSMVLLADPLEIAHGSVYEEAKQNKILKCESNCMYADIRLPQNRVINDVSIISDDLAYILYTSGSTGIPKGVMITHLNALTFVQWAMHYFVTTHQDVFSSHAPFHFDLSVFDIYVSIGSGGTVHLIPFKTGQNPRLLFDWIATSTITYWYSVPSVWIAILNHANPDFTRLKGIKKILFAGEEFPSVYLKKLMKGIPRAFYYNLYGPTETNVCTSYHVKSVDDVTDRPVPIGEACANTEIVVLNNKDEQAAIGEEGELYARGTTVTKGYYKNKEKTEQAFRKSPFPHHRAEKLYRTGDIVSRLDEKNYQFIGRKDHMVKISGFRIELSEIITTLLQYEKIEEATVTAVYDENRGSKIIYAFITVKKDQSCSIIALKEFCSRKLPYYMVPEIIIRIDTIPRNTNGKVDSKKLLDLIQRKN